MNLSKKWLCDYVNLPDISDKEFADELTLSGSKAECFEQEGARIKNVVVGKVLEMEKHPNSDHLWVCQIDAGQDGDPIQIITGAQNLKPGDVVPVALHGSYLADGTKITKGNLRGLKSNGMLCSLGELGLTVHDFPSCIEDGIMVLDEECDRTLGMDIRQAIGYNDVVTEFEITSNRSDCMSVLGLAREAAATFKVPFKMPEPKIAPGHGDVNDLLSVEIQDKEKCYRYIGGVVENVRIKPSPRWLRERLRASGVRPINNIVDITNFVMLEVGQPMHAFDLRYLDGGKVVVRTAKPGESITTLDGETRELTDDMLVIADENKPVAVAGVMGGEYSGIMDDTTTIVFESACFNGFSVRSTAKKLGMRTEASSRYEKELNPENCMYAIKRALEMVQELDAGDVVNGLVDCFVKPKPVVSVDFDVDWINHFIGIDLTKEQMTEILERLDFKIEGDTIYAPPFRNDIEHKADISEEIARFYGFQNIPNRELRGVANASYTPEQKFSKKLENTMLSCGYSEIATYSFISPKAYDKICLEKDSPLRNCVVISNPLGEDTSVMRTTPIPTTMDVLARNYNLRNPSACVYEIATTYISNGEDKLPDENQVLCFGTYGKDADFYTLKGAAEEILSCSGIDEYDIEAVTDNPTFHSGRCAKITAEKDGEVYDVALLGEIHPNVLKNYKISARTYIAVMDVKTLYKLHNPLKTYRPLPKFPAVTRDISIVCDKDIPVLKLEKLIAAAAGKHLENIELFDIYEGEQIQSGKKSVSFAISMRSAERTLTDDEADSVMKKIFAALKELGAMLRS